MPFDGTSLSQVKRDLIAARELLIEKGWVPHCGRYERVGPHCIMTALSVAAGSNPGRGDASDVLLRVSGIPMLTDLVAWNDSQRSIEPVLELFDRAIAAS